MLAGQNSARLSGSHRQMPAVASPTGRFGVVAGSDAHTLRRVGTTWTSAPGRTPDEFLAGIRRGAASVGGAHGTASTIGGDTYGVIAAYIAALAGFGPRDLSGWRRAACCGFAAVSLPFQFLPALIAARTKSRERRAVDSAGRAPGGDRPGAGAAELQTIGPS